MHAEQSGTRPWLIMLYLAGDNSLSEDMVLALQDLQAEGPPAGDKIVAQFDPSGLGLLTQRYDFSDSMKPDGTKKTRLDDYRDTDCAASETNTGSQEALLNFIKWADGRYGSKKEKKDYRHLLVLSGHGSGTTEDFLMSDESPKDSLTIDELTNALQAATKKVLRKKIDVLGMDACYMSMGEVAYQIRESVDFMVGAEGLEPEFGWPYRRILARAKAFLEDNGRHMRPKELAPAIVKEYVDHYSAYDRTAGRSVDLAAIDLGELAKVKKTFGTLVTELSRLDTPDHEKVLLAHWYAQTYKYEQFVDLRDLCDRMESQFGSRTRIGRACRNVMRSLDGCVLRSGCSGCACQYSFGLSIYFPWAVVSPDYQNLDFAEQTGWRQFLLKHIILTRRAPRYDGQARQSIDPVARKKALMGFLKKAQGVLESGTDVQEPIVAQLRRLLRLRSAAGLVENAVKRVADTDIPEEDVPGEINRRVLRARVLRDANSRYSNHTRHTDHTRSLGDREQWVKNLPPVIGEAYWP